jgi:hypothetical protein
VSEVFRNWKVMFMSRMIDSIRASAVSSNVMQTAARGALSVPPHEMLEILVYLATQMKIFAERARLTLAGWDEISSRAAAADPATPKEVLAYLIAPENLRPALLAALLENPSVSEEAVKNVAASASRHLMETLIKSQRVSQSRAILSALSSNPKLDPSQTALVAQKLSSLASVVEAGPAPAQQGASLAETDVSSMTDEPSSIPDAEDGVADEALAAYLKEHAAEISSETKPFQAIGGVHEELMIPAASSLEPHTDAVATSHSSGGAAAVQMAPEKKAPAAGEARGSALQKISKLSTQERIQLAMKGNKEERSLLIRDGIKVVALAVLESPKITDAEVEKFATQKNVLEAVLRAITQKRKFMKQYPVIRNLTTNPRTPIDVAVGLIKSLMTPDLKQLSGNKDVSETVRKMATRMFRQRLEANQK